MSTAQEIINSAARFAGILAEGQALEAAVNSDALHRLNMMLDRWRNQGVNLGLPTLLAANDIIVDPADDEAIELGLAMRLMVRHRRPIDPSVAAAAGSAFTELQAKYSIIDEMILDRSVMSRKSIISGGSY